MQPGASPQSEKGKREQREITHTHSGMTPNLLLTLDLARFTRRDAASHLPLPSSPSLYLVLSLSLSLTYSVSSRLLSLSHTIGALINYTARCANSSIKIIISCCGCCCGQNVDCCRIYVSHGLLAARAEQLTLSPSLSLLLFPSLSLSLTLTLFLYSSFPCRSVTNF